MTTTRQAAASKLAFDVSDADARDYYVTGLDIAGGITRMLTAATAGSYRVLRTGIAPLDRDVTIAPGTVTAILGRPSMGKSTLMKTIVRNELATMAAERKSSDDRSAFIAYVTLEEPAEKIGLQLAGVTAFTWREILRGEVAVTPDVKAAVLRAAVALEDVKVIRHPGMREGRILAPLSAERVMRTIEQLCDDYRQRPRLVVLDYLQLLHGEGMRLSERSKTEHVMAASAGAVLMSRSLGVPVIMAVQASRETDQRGGRDELPMPGLRDCMWAASIEQDCDNILGVVRPIAVAGVREQVAGGALATVTIGGQAYTLNESVGSTLFAVGAVKTRNDDAIGKRYVAHVDPADLSVFNIERRDE